MRSYNILILGVIVVCLGIILVVFTEVTQYFLISLTGLVIMCIALIKQNNEIKK
jgi:FtsH-binding integral membrane protein